MFLYFNSHGFGSLIYQETISKFKFNRGLKETAAVNKGLQGTQWKIVKPLGFFFLIYVLQLCYVPIFLVFIRFIFSYLYL